MPMANGKWDTHNAVHDRSNAQPVRRIQRALDPATRPDDFPAEGRGPCHDARYTLFLR